MSFIKPKISQIVNTKKVISAIVLAIFAYQVAAPFGLVQAHGIVLLRIAKITNVSCLKSLQPSCF